MTSDRPLNEGEARDLARNLDARVSPYAIHHTDAALFLDDLRDDYGDGKIGGKVDGNEVRFAIVSSGAELQEISPREWQVGGNRRAEGYSSKYVSASYFRGGMLVYLSAYCGVSWTAKFPPPARGVAMAHELTRATALALSDTRNRVLAAITTLPGVKLRRGGVVFDNSAEPWIAHYLEQIDAGPDLTCASCGQRIYWANREWRHASTKRSVALVDGPCEICKGSGNVWNNDRPELCRKCRGAKISARLDHLADPLEKERKV